MVKKAWVAIFLLVLLFYYFCFLLIEYLSVLFNHDIKSSSKWTVVLALWFLTANSTAVYCAFVLAETPLHGLCSWAPQGQAGKHTVLPLGAALQAPKHRALGASCGIRSCVSSAIQFSQATNKLSQNSFGEQTCPHWPVPGPGSDLGVGHHRVLVLKGKFSLLNGNSKTNIINEITRLNPLLLPLGCVEGCFYWWVFFAFGFNISFHVSFFIDRLHSDNPF